MESPQKGSHFGSHPHLLGTAYARKYGVGISLTIHPDKMRGPVSIEISMGHLAGFFGVRRSKLYLVQDIACLVEITVLMEQGRRRGKPT
jgi:hypothetical protein